MSEGPRMHPLEVRRVGAPLARPGEAAVIFQTPLGSRDEDTAPGTGSSSRGETWVLGTSSTTHRSYLTEPQSAHL